MGRAVFCVCLLLTGSARADDTLTPLLQALENPAAVEAAVRALGAEWESELLSARWQSDAEAPRRFVARVSPELRNTFAREHVPERGRDLVLSLLHDLRDPSSESFFIALLRDGSTPPRWTARAADALARIGTDAAKEQVIAALMASASIDDRAPSDHAWGLCHAAVDAAPVGDLTRELAGVVRRLFDFAPALAVQACLSLVLRVPSVGDLAREVLEAERWPHPLVSDPRDAEAILPYAQGAALIVLANLRAPDALRRLEGAMADRSLRALPIRDGAAQGLGVVGGPRARLALRRALGDPFRRSPRVVNTLLRLGDRPSVPLLRRTALDPRAEVELRMAASNAYTLLAPASSGLTPRWENDLGALGPMGAPFEALDGRLSTFATRLAAAERCRANRTCWTRTVFDHNEQAAARALWELAVTGRFNQAEQTVLAEALVQLLEITPPGERHDLIAGAIALFARIDHATVAPHRDAISRASSAWQGRTNPMHLPFDIPLALQQLARRSRD